MRFPIPIGQAARLLGTSEPRLSETVRRGHVTPAPRVIAGRRIWEAQHIRQAAAHLGVLTPELEDQLAVSSAPGGKAA